MRIQRSAGKIRPLRLAFQRHLRHWKWNRSISYLWLPISIHSNYGPVSRRFSVENIRKFFLPLYLTPPLTVLPFEFCNRVWVQKPDWQPYQIAKTMYAIFSTKYQHRLDRPTDRQNAALFVCWRAIKTSEVRSPDGACRGDLEGLKHPGVIWIWYWSERSKIKITHGYIICA